MLSFRTKWRNNRGAYLKVAADGSAATTTAETPFYTARYRETLLRAKYTPAAALTSNDTNYATLKVWKRSVDGATQTAIGSEATTTTDTGSWTAFVSVEVALLATALAPGESLLFEITKAGTGVAVPAGILEIQTEVN
jgi:hypothetical protein